MMNGIIKENPTFVLLLGMCPTLGTTSSAINGMGMGLATMFVLICSNVVISLIKNLIPDMVRIPSFIVVIASFVTLLQMVMQAYVPGLYATLGLFIPLIVVNCIVLGRAEAFAAKNNALASMFDGIGMGLGFTIVCVLFLFLPMIYRGVSPIFSAVVVAVITTVVTIYLISGISVKSLTAISGTVTGVVMAVIFAGIFGKVTQITGYNVSDIEELIYLEEKTAIKINELLFAGILIASLGAVMDVGMSIASTLQEIYSRRPDLGMWDLFKSGMNVGKDMMGTMSNTLILAFAGGSLNTLVFIFAYNYSYHQIINMYSIGIELMQGISASMGVILTVPFTSLAGAFFISGKVLKK